MAKKDAAKDAEKEEAVKPEAKPDVADALRANYEEVFAKATEEWELASKLGNREIISKAAQKIADIKEQERVRVANIPGYAERLVDIHPQTD